MLPLSISMCIVKETRKIFRLELCWFPILHYILSTEGFQMQFVLILSNSERCAIIFFFNHTIFTFFLRIFHTICFALWWLWHTRRRTTIFPPNIWGSKFPQYVCCFIAPPWYKPLHVRVPNRSSAAISPVRLPPRVFLSLWKYPISDHVQFLFPKSHFSVWFVFPWEGSASSFFFRPKLFFCPPVAGPSFWFRKGHS